MLLGKPPRHRPHLPAASAATTLLLEAACTCFMHAPSLHTSSSSATPPRHALYNPTPTCTAAAECKPGPNVHRGAGASVGTAAPPLGRVGVRMNLLHAARQAAPPPPPPPCCLCRNYSAAGSRVNLPHPETSPTSWPAVTWHSCRVLLSQRAGPPTLDVLIDCRHSQVDHNKCTSRRAAQPCRRLLIQRYARFSTPCQQQARAGKACRRRAEPAARAVPGSTRAARPSGAGFQRDDDVLLAIGTQHLHVELRDRGRLPAGRCTWVEQGTGGKNRAPCSPPGIQAGVLGTRAMRPVPLPCALASPQVLASAARGAGLLLPALPSAL